MAPIHTAPCYVVDGIGEIETEVPAGHVVIAFRHGIRPKCLPLPPTARSVTVAPMDGNDRHGLPIVLMVMPSEHVDMWTRTPQAFIDELVASAVSMQARATCAGSA